MRLAFCFPGQGSQAVGMGRDLAEAVPAARAVYEEGSEAAGLDLARLCFEGPLEELTRTDLQQPALVATSLACLRAIETRGIHADCVLGHSVGEYAALAAAGALSQREAISLVRERGEATAQAAEDRPGSMAAVIGLDDDVVEELCRETGGVWPANYNCPGQLVVSGEPASVERVLSAARERGARKTVPLRVTGAFHSPLVGSAVERLRPAIEQVVWREPSPAFMSTVTAEFEPARRIGGILLEQLTRPVRFTQAVGALVAQGVNLFVEVGPGAVLSGLIRRCDRSVTTVSVADTAGLGKLEEALAAV
ncbi:MAG: ACP S-malonyltransferase [Thermoleophilia bacterium]|nr:ACP S-malonyltransferase [Thermoleophilia bacterium]